MISRFQRATETAEMIFNHLLSTPSAGGLGNVKGAKRSGAFISTLDIPKTGGYLEFSRDRLHLDKSFSKNAASVLTNSAYQRGELQFSGKIAHLGSKAAFNRFLAGLYAIEWGVHVKPSFKNPGRVLDYLGRYTHRVAISNHRLIRMADDQVTFSYRDSADRNRRKQMTLSAHEFIRRFLLHVLPPRFVRIRHYGILSNCNKRRKLVFSQELLGARAEPPEADPAESWQEKLLRLTGIDLFTCPICHKGIMRPQENVISMSARSPPIECITGTAVACF